MAKQTKSPDEVRTPRTLSLLSTPAGKVLLPAIITGVLVLAFLLAVSAFGAPMV